MNCDKCDKPLNYRQVIFTHLDSGINLCDLCKPSTTQNLIEWDITLSPGWTMEEEASFEQFKEDFFEDVIEFELEV